MVDVNAQFSLSLRHLKNKKFNQVGKIFHPRKSTKFMPNVQTWVVHKFLILNDDEFRIHTLKNLYFTLEKETDISN